MYLYCRLTSGQSLIDAPGTLLVGAKSPGSDRFIGYIQEPRLFTHTLQLRYDLFCTYMYLLPTGDTKEHLLFSADQSNLVDLKQHNLPISLFMLVNIR